MNKLLLGLLMTSVGCSSSAPGTVDGSTADLSIPGDMVTPDCAGTFTPTGTAQFAWIYTTCRVSASATPNDLTLRISPQANQGTPPSEVMITLTAAPTIAKRTYSLADLSPGTLVEVTAQQSLSKYHASRPEDGSADIGSLTLVIFSLPVQPAGVSDWNDSDVHGTLNASLALDPNSPGTPGDTVTYVARF